MACIRLMASRRRATSGSAVVSMLVWPEISNFLWSSGNSIPEPAKPLASTSAVRAIIEEMFSIGDLRPVPPTAETVAGWPADGTTGIIGRSGSVAGRFSMLGGRTAWPLLASAASAMITGDGGV